jgi:hypothetical protein
MADTGDPTTGSAPRRAANARALRAELERLERELEALAAAFDRWWSTVPGGNGEYDGAPDLREGARLHEEIAARMGRLAAVRAALARTSQGLEPPR